MSALVGFAKACLVALISAGFVLGCLVLFGGCFPAAAVVPVTPVTQAQVSSCQALAADHNAIVVGDFSIGLAGTTAAGIAAGLSSSDPGAARGVAIGAAGAGAIAAGGLALASYYSSAYAAQNCAQVLGPLPVLPAKPLPPEPGVTVVVSADAGAK